ncbi:MAG: hypothetical protein ACE5HX_14475 [bacterium]
MGQQELILTLGAIVLFSLVSLSVNRLVVNHTDAIYSQQAELYAVSVAQQFIEEAKLKAFDENTITGTVSNPGGFSSWGQWGFETGETYPNFDDVDDFHGFTTTLTTDVGAMTINITVDYVEDSDLDVPVTPTKTYYKKMTVIVQSDYLINPVTAEYIFAFQKNP